MICYQFIQQCLKANEKYQQLYNQKLYENTEVAGKNSEDEADKALESQEYGQDEFYEVVEVAESDHSDDLPVFSDISENPSDEEHIEENVPDLENEPKKLVKIVKNSRIVQNFESIKIQEGDKIKYKTKCPICSTFQQNLKQHMLIHTGEKRFSCPYCNKKFAQIGNYNQHILIHQGSKSFVCKECGKSCSNQKNLKSHMVSWKNYFYAFSKTISFRQFIPRIGISLVKYAEIFISILRV